MTTSHIALGVTVGETTVLTSVLVDDRDVVADEFAGAGLIRAKAASRPPRDTAIPPTYHLIFQ
ncbi:hypothetical protein [Catenuloplanes japonicus]|uniref:hypothetical protein n=1 Tax=Catenuloplanes japonicus TaxID=33876 RepID=UPI0005246C16|nr:hypothetical protein [Catenuloplanes japonicus]